MHYSITAESEGERILKNGQHLRQLWSRIKVGVFLRTQCTTQCFDIVAPKIRLFEFGDLTSVYWLTM